MFQEAQCIELSGDPGSPQRQGEFASAAILAMSATRIHCVIA